MDFEKKILNELLNKYERSNASKFDNAKHKPIRLEIRDKVFEGKRNGSIELDEAIARIEKLDFCKITYVDGELSRIELVVNQSNIARIYRYLNRSNPADRKSNLLKYLHEIESTSSSVVTNLKNDFISQIEQGKFFAIESFYGAIEDLKDSIKALNEIALLEQDIPERVFSVKVFSDSKRFSAIRHKVERIIRDYGDEPFDEDDDVIAACGVVKNVTYAFIKGNIVLNINGQNIDLNLLGNEFAINDSMIQSMKIEKINASKLITVENLTSFYQENSSDSVIIYLGGFHNKIRRDLIVKIYNSCRDIRPLHFGDIDAGGFYILNHLRAKTGIKFAPLKMSIHELIQYRDYCKRLTENDKKRLLKMKTDPAFEEFGQIISYMLENDIKLEQEAEN